jgi:hypothetical protein
VICSDPQIRKFNSVYLGKYDGFYLIYFNLGMLKTQFPYVCGSKPKKMTQYGLPK